jgi:hypothetical protein
MGELHSRKDDRLEQTGLSVFGHVVVYAGVALLVVFLVALLVVKMMGRHIESINPDRHPTSRLISGASDRQLV